MTQYKNLKLDQQLCFALYAATHAITRVYRNALEQYGLTYPQYLVMLVLWESDGISVSTIANKLELDSGTLTPMLKKLEVAGLVSRTRNKQDERIVIVMLTDKGNKLQHEIASIQKGVACQTGLSDDNFVILKDSLHQLVQTLKPTE